MAEKVVRLFQKGTITLLVFTFLLFAGNYLKKSRKTYAYWYNTGSGRWPPKHPSVLLDSQTGFYNMTLQPRIETDENYSDWIQHYVRQLDILSEGKYVKGSRMRQLVHVDTKMRMESQIPNYWLYPQAIDVRPIVAAIKRGDTISQVPINNPEILITTTPRQVCSPKIANTLDSSDNKKIYDVIIIVKSCTFCFEERQRDRSTYMQHHLWSGLSIGFVFIIGQPCMNKTLLFDFEGLHMRASIKLPKYEGLDEEQSYNTSLARLQDESTKYGDLIIGSFLDTYYNLTLKQITAFRWATAFCRDLAELFIFIDHDRSLIPDGLIRFIHKIPSDLRPQMAGGSPSWGYRINRRGKWAISEDELPWNNYPAYPPGQCYLLGSKILEDVSIASAFTKLLRIEDAYLGIIFQKLNRLFLIYDGFSKSLVKLSDPRKAICVTNKDADRFYDWDTGAYK